MQHVICLSASFKTTVTSKTKRGRNENTHQTLRSSALSIVIQAYTVYTMQYGLTHNKSMSRYIWCYTIMFFS